MNQSPDSFVTINEILSDVTKLVKDAELRMCSKGWYTSQVQQCLEELAFDTYFNEITEEFVIPENKRIPMPKGAFNIRQMYLFSGDKCNIGTRTPNVYYKRNFWSGGNGFVARNKGRNLDDPFYQNRSSFRNERQASGVVDGNRGRTPISQIYHYGIQNGIIMLSDNCLTYEKILLVYNGVNTEIGEVPIIPTFLRQAVKDWVSNMALEIKLTEVIGTPSFAQWQAIKAGVQTRLEKPFDGSWAKAEHRLKTMDTKEREDLKEYLSRPDIG